MRSALERFARWLEASSGISLDVLLQIAGTLFVIAVYALATRAARRITTRAVDDARSRYQVRKAATYALGIIALAVLARIWLQGISGIATYFGLLSAGVAVALQDPIIDLAGWLFIVMRRPFRAGDRIQIGEHAGDVVDVRIFHFTLLEIGQWVGADHPTGRVVHVPNGWVFKNPIANFDRGLRYVWNEVKVVVTFESSWRRAKEILLGLAQDLASRFTTGAEAEIAEAAEHYHIEMPSLTPVVLTRAVDSGVELTVRYVCRPRERRASEHALWEAVLDALAQHNDVDLAYPTRRVFDNVVEGKPNARASPPAAASAGRTDAG